MSRARRTEQNVQRGLESAHTLTVWGGGVAEPRPVRSPAQPGPGGGQQGLDQQGPSPLSRPAREPEVHHGCFHCWEGGLASNLPEATASSHTFARQAAGVGWARAGPEPHRPHPAPAMT